jgi:Flp pilus assembly pilin Flp
MRRICNLVSRLWKDEQGGEVLEYAIVAGLIVVGAIAFITLVGGKVKTTWENLNTGMP